MRKTILITGARAPAALHLARIFYHAGHRVVLADTFRYPMSRATRMKHAYAQLPSPRQSFAAYGAAVASPVAREAPDIIAPTCEALRIVKRELDARTTLLGFCGAPWTVATYMVAGQGTPDQVPARLFALTALVR